MFGFGLWCSPDGFARPGDLVTSNQSKDYKVNYTKVRQATSVELNGKGLGLFVEL